MEGVRPGAPRDGASSASSRDAVDRSLQSQDPGRIAAMFDGIAGTYDRLNHLLSAGLDRRWRSRAVEELRLHPHDVVLDLCTGTADLAIAAAAGGSPRVLGLDFSAEMLRMAARKLAARSHPVALVRADAMRLPLASESVDAVTIGFGIRNVQDRDAACRESHRVLRQGGRLAILEFGLPQTRGLRAAYLWYFEHALPRIGRMISRHPEAYTYLPVSVGTFPPPERFVQDLQRAGFRRVRAIRLTFGTVYLYIANK